MKIRHGFVSNSSSSSFVISVPHGTELTLEAFHQALYGRPDNFKFAPTWTWNDQVGIDSYDAVNAILAQITEKADAEKLTSTIDVHIDYEQYLKPGEANEFREYDWDAINEAEDAALKVEAARLMELMKSEDIYTVSFSDNDGEFFSQMEHGEAMNSIKGVIRYSYH